MDRKNFLSINFLKQESWKQRAGAQTGESQNFTFRMQMEGLHIGKIKICRLHQRVHVISSVKFTFKTSVIQMPARLIIVAQDTKISEYIAFKLTEQPGKQFRPKQLHIPAVSKTGTYFKV